jgi:hypothetical protein
MPQPETGRPVASKRPTPEATPTPPTRRELERANVHLGLKTRTPGESLSGQWEAEWWNGPKRPVRAYPTEDELITDLRRLFGPPDGDDGEP